MTATLASIPIYMGRASHVSDYGEGSCVFDAFRYAAPLFFATGLGLGISGTMRSRQFDRAHGPVARERTPWRAALAGLGIGLAMAGMGSALGVAGICNS